MIQLNESQLYVVSGGNGGTGVMANVSGFTQSVSAAASAVGDAADYAVGFAVGVAKGIWENA